MSLSNSIELTGESAAENSSAETPKRKRGRPKLTEEQKAAVRAKREAGKTRRFLIGEEPNRRSPVT